MKKLKIPKAIIVVFLFTFISISAFSVFVINRHFKTNLSPTSKNYKIVRIMGGLGNQLFQYAFGISLHKKTGYDILYERNFFDEQKHGENGCVYRYYCLDFYNTCVDLATKEQIDACTDVQENELRKHAISYFKNGKNERFIGYFQSANYYEDCKEEILEAFKLKIPLDEKNKTLIEEIKEKNSVSVHIRRTDYLNSPDIVIPIEND